jgi:ATP-dependent exoDNAse (exonuclease V) beta subunit
MEPTWIAVASVALSTVAAPSLFGLLRVWLQHRRDRVLEALSRELRGLPEPELVRRAERHPVLTDHAQEAPVRALRQRLGSADLRPILQRWNTFSAEMHAALPDRLDRRSLEAHASVSAQLAEVKAILQELHARRNGRVCVPE